MIWMALVLFYGILKGSREFVKKEAMRKNSVMEVIVAYTVLSFIFVIPQAPHKTLRKEPIASAHNE